MNEIFIFQFGTLFSTTYTTNLLSGESKPTNMRLRQVSAFTPQEADITPQTTKEDHNPRPLVTNNLKSKVLYYLLIMG